MNEKKIIVTAVAVLAGFVMFPEFSRAGYATGFIPPSSDTSGKGVVNRSTGFIKPGSDTSGKGTVKKNNTVVIRTNGSVRAKKTSGYNCSISVKTGRNSFCMLPSRKSGSGKTPVVVKRKSSGGMPVLY